MFSSRRQSRSNKPVRRKVHLRCEALEDRSVPAAFSFSTGLPDGKMATGSRPADALNKNVEVETGDDFILSHETVLSKATFTGLVPAGSTVKDVVVEIYRVFPKDSDLARTIHVPTRVNSPSDIAFTTREGSSELSFSTTTLKSSFTAKNSVLNGIHPLPNVRTGGEGPRTGKEVRFNVNFKIPLDLPPDHYFFVPQVLLSKGDFFWLSAPKPTTPPFQGDLQAWIRNDPKLAPDWLRIGTDIVGGNPAPTFNASFSLSGQTLTPSIKSISKASVVEGTGNTNIAVHGTNFTSATQVLFDGTPLATTFVNATTLQAAIPASLLVEEGADNIQALDPQGGLSNAIVFHVTESVPKISATAAKVSGSEDTVHIAGLLTDNVAEAHTVVINWGDGSSTTLNQGVNKAHHFERNHLYKAPLPSSRTITVQAFDDVGTPSNKLTFVIHFDS